MVKTSVPDVVAQVKSIAKDNFNAHKHSFTKLGDRGDPDNPDFTQVTLTGDLNWYDLNLSSISGAQACWVCLRVFLMDSRAGSYLQVRTKGNTYSPNSDVMITPAAWVAWPASLWVYTNPVGVAQYFGAWTGAAIVRVTVGGYEK